MDSASIFRVGFRLDSRLLYVVRFMNLEIQVQMPVFHDVVTILIYLDSALLNRWNIDTLHIHAYNFGVSLMLAWFLVAGHVGSPISHA